MNSREHARVELDQPFELKFELVIAGALPQQLQQMDPSAASPIRHRAVRLAVQHILPMKDRSASKFRNTGATSVDNLVLEDAFRSTIVRSGYYTPHSNDLQSFPSPLSAGDSSIVALTGLPARLASVRQREGLPSTNPQSPLHPIMGELSRAVLPSPFSRPLFEHKGRPDAAGRVTPLGPTLSILPPLQLIPHTHPRPTLPAAGTAASVHDHPVTHGSARTEFSLSYAPVARGFAEIGGLRILLLGDWETEREQPLNGEEQDTSTKVEHARVLRTWEVIGELWVH
jgi:hypothetical protein